MKKGWQKENLEKTKEVLKEHFKRKKQEEMVKEMYREFMLFSTLPQPHYGDNWEIDGSEFDEIKDDFIDNFIWKDLTDSNDKKDKGCE